MRSKLFELVRTTAANVRSRPWLAAAIPGGLEQLLRQRLFTTEYILHLAHQTKAVKDSPPPESDYPTASPWRIGIVHDLFYNHESYIAACRELKVAYKTVDLFASDWIQQVREARCDAFVAWPSECLSEWKRMYDERLKLINQEMGILIYPPVNALWLYGSKQRMHSWLEIHGFPHAKTLVFYLKDEALAFLESAVFPLVLKLDIGAAANGVWIVQSKHEAEKMVLQVFANGLAGKRWDVRARQWRYILMQEFVPNLREWRMIRVGESYFGHEKGQLGDFHSGSGKVGWFAPPRAALDLLHQVTETGGFRSMAMDLFQTADGRFLINELQSVFGAVDTAQMYIDGVPGRYQRMNGEFIFEEGRFCGNACCNLRVEDLLNILESTSLKKRQGAI